MKKYLYITIASLIAFVACDKEARVQEEVPGNEPVAEKLVSITASIPSDGLNTKVSITEADNGAGKMRLTKLSWEEGDEITVNSKTFTVKTGSISGDGLTATFQGEDPGAGPYNITYTNVPGDLNNQLQPADGDPSDVGYSVSLTGADTYEGATFSSSWAGSHGATFAQSSVLQLRALLPAAVAAGVKKVIFKSTANIFNGSNTLTVTLTSAGTTGTDNKLDVYAMLPAGNITLAADMDLLVQFEMDGGNAYDKYTAFRHFASGTNFVQSGCTKYMGLDCSNIDKYANASATSIGESTNPYLIGDKHQLIYMHTSMTAGQTKYYKLVDDVDLDGETWQPLNNEDPYSKGISFDGNGHTIDHLTTNGTSYEYPSFIGILKGSISNVKFDNAEITCSDKKGGVVAGYIGHSTKGFKGNCSNVEIDNATLTSAEMLGGFAAQGDKVGTITNCRVLNSSISSTGSRIGGIIGSLVASDEISDCYVEDTNISSNQYAGGLIGQFSGGGTVSGCHSTGTVSSTASYARSGGLIGYLSSGTVEDCYSTCNLTLTGYYGGGLVGEIKSGTINTSYATGDLSTGSGNTGQLGGLLGLVQSGGTVEVNNCYSICAMTAGRRCGGLIGKNEGSPSFTNCYTSPTFTTNAPGAAIGWNSGSMTLSGVVFWSSLSALVGYGTAVAVPDGSHLGQDETILKYAQSYSWNFSTIWNEVNPPTLR